MLYLFEGINGSGKTTVAKAIAERLQCNLIEFPNYNSPSGKLIKEYLESLWRVETFALATTSSSSYASAMAFQALNVANRMEIMPSLVAAQGDRTNHLVLTRYWQSGWVYGQMDGLDRNWLLNIHRAMTRPDISFLVNTLPEVAMERLTSRDSGLRARRYEDKLGKLQQAAKLYNELWSNVQYNFGGHLVIDGGKKPEEVFDSTASFIDTHRRETC